MCFNSQDYHASTLLIKYTEVEEVGAEDMENINKGMAGIEARSLIMSLLVE